MRYILSVFLGLALSAHGDSLEPVTQKEKALEAAAIKSLVASAVKGIREQAKQGPIATRDAHAKAHGCVRAKFVVEASLPAEYRQGVFQENAEYDAWIRYSNGAQKKDFEGDGRGMAIKLTNVPGKKYLDDEKHTQDFLMINHPVFFVRTPSDYVEFQAAVKAGKPQNFFFPSLNPLKWRTHEFGIVRAIRGKTVENPLSSDYFSMAPILMGERAAKVKVWPCHKIEKEKTDWKDENLLRAAMKRQLERRKQGACFHFGVQLQRNAAKQPVEDATIEWSEKISKYVKVATLTIEPQDFDSKAQNHFCENLSFTPWHTVLAHRPLGAIQRIRLPIYQATSAERHALNKEPFIEPTGKEKF